MSLRLANITGMRLAIGPIPTFYERLRAGQRCFCTDTVQDFLHISDFLALMRSCRAATPQPESSMSRPARDTRSGKCSYGRGMSRCHSARACLDRTAFALGSLGHQRGARLRPWMSAEPSLTRRICCIAITAMPGGSLDLRKSSMRRPDFSAALSVAVLRHATKFSFETF